MGAKLRQLRHVDGAGKAISVGSRGRITEAMMKKFQNYHGKVNCSNVGNPKDVFGQFSITAALLMRTHSTTLTLIPMCFKLKVRTHLHSHQLFRQS